MNIINYRRIFLLLFTLLLLSCSDNSTNTTTNNINGVWNNSESLDVTHIGDSWIPTNLHIESTNNENIIHVRILDPIACTDSYPILANSTITFSQYELSIKVFFETENSGTLTATKNDSSITFPIYKTDQQPYWGMCD